MKIINLKIEVRKSKVQLIN